jgi:hypothetical protein
VEELARARHDQLLVEEVGDELVVYDLGRGEVHLLNPVAAFVWRRCDGRTTVTELAALLRAELELPTTEDVVLLALDELGAKHLLEKARAVPALLSRHQAIKKLATFAGVGLMLPIVESIKAPPAWAAASMASSGCSTPANGCGVYPDCAKGTCVETGCDCVVSTLAATECVCERATLPA